MKVLETFIEYASIWMPSLVAILGVVTTVLTCLSKTKETIDEFKKDKTLKEVNEKLKKVVSENDELIRCNKLLLDQITKIQGYADAKKGE